MHNLVSACASLPVRPMIQAIAQATCGATRAPTAAKCVDDHAVMMSYTGLNCTAIKAGGACAQITGNAQLKAIGANTKCGCSCPVAAATTKAPSKATMSPTTAATISPTTAQKIIRGVAGVNRHCHRSAM